MIKNFILYRRFRSAVIFFFVPMKCSIKNEMIFRLVKWLIDCGSALLINTFFISFIIKHNLIFFYGGGGRVGTTTEDPWKMCVDFIFLLRSSFGI